MSSIQASAQYIPKFDVQGHRGARGLRPENTIPAFLIALEYGMTTLELDVVISADNQVVVSHEPWMSAAICSEPNGDAITTKEEKSFNLYKMTYDSIRMFDCGRKGNPNFPEQEKMSSHKPLLKEVIMAVEDYIRSYTQYEVDYNIEIKSEKEGDGKYQPAPAEFCELVYKEISQYLPMNRVVIQSFDIRVLQYLHNKYPTTRLALLVENLKSVDANLKSLGFTPNIYSPHFKLLNKDKINYLHQRKIRVIPWTVNEVTDMRTMKNLGVDGIITDYPNRAADLGYGVRRIKQGSGKNVKAKPRN